MMNFLPFTPHPFKLEEHEDIEADSVTKLHQDMSDACNILVHCQKGRDEEAMNPERGPRCGMEPAIRGSRWVGSVLLGAIRWVGRIVVVGEGGSPQMRVRSYVLMDSVCVEPS